MSKKSGLLWSLAFIGIFLLSQDYLFTKWESVPGVLGFPNWLAWFVLIHLIFIFAFYWFSKKHWK